MSAMANTTPIVTTVTKTATKEKTPKETDAAPRVNILDFCEEHYEDILPVIMDKIRRDKRKEVHTRLDFGDNTKRSRRIREGSQNSSAGTLSARAHLIDLATLTRQAQLSPGRTGQALGIILTVEVALTDETLLLAGIVLEVETALVASKNHMVIHAPPTGQGPDMGIILAIGIALVSCKEERKVNPHYLAYRRAAPAMEDTGSQSKKGTSLRMKKT
ncbi:hypothetical protein Tco_0200514 [Tanacetum coccineum]